MKLIYKILGGILLLAIFSVFLFSLYKGDIEKSNLTDWISAFCNLAMAGAAFGGYLIAKDWKKNAVKDKLINFAVDLKVKRLNKLKDNSYDFQLSMEKLDMHFPVIEYAVYSMPQSLNFIHHSITGLKTILNLSKGSINELNADYENIKAIGYEFTENYSKVFLELRGFYNEYHETTESLIRKIDGYLYFFDARILGEPQEDFFSHVKYPVSVSVEQNNMIRNELDKLFDLHEKINSNLKDFIELKGSVLNLFIYIE